jgi:superfamily II DNA/RNA helicase
MNAPRKALIFTESRRTQQYLYNLLEAQGYQGKILLFNGTNADPRSNEIYKDWLADNKDTSRVTGSKTADKRLALVDYFRDKAEIMIATEAAAEGINLQFCSLIVNYDLPWNPQRVEQRIGRCHRYGQKYDVVVVNFINKSNRADQRVYELLDQKFNLFKGVFGASDEVLGSIGNGIDFEKRILNIYKQCRTTEDIDQAFDQLQDELRDDIKDNIQQTRASLFENFDEEVIEKLKIREEEESARLDQYTKLLWELTCGVLRSQIKVNARGNCEFYLEHDIRADIPHGVYTLSKEASHGYTYRISHPLAEYVIKEAVDAETPNAAVEFDYSRNDTVTSNSGC